MKKLSKMISVIGIVSTLASPVHAMSDFGEGLIAGIAGTILMQGFTRPYAPHIHMQPYPVVPYYPGTMYPDYTYRPMYRSVDVFIPECQCYRTTTVQIR